MPLIKPKRWDEVRPTSTPPSSHVVMAWSCFNLSVSVLGIVDLVEKECLVNLNAPFFTT